MQSRMKWNDGAKLPVMKRKRLTREESKEQTRLRLLDAAQSIFDEGASREEIEARALAFYSQFFRQNDCFLLWAEAKLLATRDTKFRARFNAFWREKHMFFTEYARLF